MSRKKDDLGRPLMEPPVPLESAEQEALFMWAEYNLTKYPELRWMYHIPNEGKRSFQRGAQMRREGLKRGVPDNCLPVARGNYSALYIEMKRIRGGRMTADQKEWAEGLQWCGNLVIRCDGWEEAARAIEQYLNCWEDFK